MQVFKYHLPRDLNIISVPLGWRALCLAEQRGQKQIWLEVDPRAPREDVAIQRVGTGQDIPACSLHVGTFVTSGGDYVWHYYARPAASPSSN